MNKYGILAYPAKHSLSPLIHNTGFEFLGINSRYEIFEIEPNNLDNFMSNLQKNGVSGLSVSMPFKQDVIKYLDEIDDISQKLNSVNTIYFKDGKSYGTNTDIYGILIPLLNTIYGESIELMDLTSGNFTIEIPGKEKINYSIAILGAGGAASSACFAAKYISNNVSIFNRTLDKAKELADKFDLQAFELKDLDTKKFDIILQMTSIGMLKDGKSNGSISENIKNGKLELNSNQIIFESIYNPIETELIKTAKKCGCKIITGENMLIYQALKQFTIWTGKKAPVHQIKNALFSKISTSF